MLKFDDTVKKEMYFYNYVNEKNYMNPGNIQDALKHIKNATLEEFNIAIDIAESRISKTEFDILKYTEYYC